MYNEIKYRVEVGMLLSMKDDNGGEFDFPLFCTVMVDDPFSQEQIDKAAGDALIAKAEDFFGSANDMGYIKREAEKIKNDPNNQFMLMHLYERRNEDGVNA